MDVMFNIFPVMFFAVFALIFGVFIFTFVRSIGQWSKNHHSPRLTVPVTVVAKRTNISRHRHGGVNGHHHHTTSTTYYVTFQVESGDRMELRVDPSQYGLIVEGDQGKLTFQGTRFLNFERILNP